VHGTTTPALAGTRLTREQLIAGTWSPVTTALVEADGSWNDTFQGSHDDRVRYRAPAAGLRLSAVSAAFRVDGSWQPTITVLSATMDPINNGGVIAGVTEGLPPGTPLFLEMKVSHWGWVPYQDIPTSVEDDQSFIGHFSTGHPARFDRQFRYRAAADGLRADATSEPFSVSEGPPARVHLDSTTPLYLPEGATHRRLVIHLEKDQVFNCFSPLTAVSFISPSGAQLDACAEPRSTDLDTAPETGDYVLTLGYPPSIDPRFTQVTLSSLRTVPTTVDAPGQLIETTLPGQTVELVFDAPANSVVSEYGGPDAETSGRVSLLDPAGAPVSPWDASVDATSVPVWKLPDITGAYRLRITPQGNHDFLIRRPAEAVLAADVDVITLNEIPARSSFDRPGRIAVATVDVPASVWPLRLTTDPDDLLLRAAFGPDGTRIPSGAVIGEISNPEEGTYTILMAPPTYRGFPYEVDTYASVPEVYEGTVGTEAVEYDGGPAPARQVLFRVTGDPGQMLSFHSRDDAGAWCERYNDGFDAAGVPVQDTQSGWNQPTVYTIPQTGVLYILATTCTAQGTLHAVPTAAPVTVDPVTNTARLEITLPGQVAILDYDTHGVWHDSVRFLGAGSTFPEGTTFAWGRTGSGWRDLQTVDTTLTDVRGQERFFLWAGMSAVGAMDVVVEESSP
jgi:hypothetical protein